MSKMNVHGREVAVSHSALNEDYIQIAINQMDILTHDHRVLALESKAATKGGEQA